MTQKTFSFTRQTPIDSVQTFFAALSLKPLCESQRRDAIEWVSLGAASLDVCLYKLFDVSLGAAFDDFLESAFSLSQSALESALPAIERLYIKLFAVAREVASAAQPFAILHFNLERRSQFDFRGFLCQIDAAIGGKSALLSALGARQRVEPLSALLSAADFESLRAAASRPLQTDELFLLLDSLLARDSEANRYCFLKALEGVGAERFESAAERAAFSQLAAEELAAVEGKGGWLSAHQLAATKCALEREELLPRRGREAENQFSVSNDEILKRLIAAPRVKALRETLLRIDRSIGKRAAACEKTLKRVRKIEADLRVLPEEQRQKVFNSLERLLSR